MKRIIITATLLLCLVLTSGARTVNLSDWTLSRNGQAAEYAAKVPATVAGVLSRNNFYGEDLMAGTAYYSADKSIFDDAWTFRTTFDAPHNCKEHCLLTFNGLNYYADIVLNGKKIASSDTTYGVFVRRTFGITKLARKSGNVLSVTLRRARMEKGDLNIGFVDWNPRPIDESMGITNTVELKTVGNISLSEPFVKPELDVNTLKSDDIFLRDTHESRTLTCKVSGGIEGNFSVQTWNSIVE